MRRRAKGEVLVEAGELTPYELHGMQPVLLVPDVKATVGYYRDVLGFAQLFPEFLVLAPTSWIVVFLIWGQLAESARKFNPPPIFPRRDDDKLHMRPQEDMAVDDETDKQLGADE